jgi:hypothetical protein
MRFLKAALLIYLETFLFTIFVLAPRFSSY